MSMHNHACCGHVVKTSELTNLIPERILPEWNVALQENDADKAQEILEEYLLEQYPRPESCFVVNDAAFETEELEFDVMYTYWNREDLFVQIRSPKLMALVDLGINPEFKHWVTFG